MFNLDFFGTSQVGNGARHFQDAVVGAGRETQPLHCRFEQHTACIANYTGIFNDLRGHHGVRIYPLVVGEAFGLNIAGFNYPRPDSLARFGGAVGSHLVERDGRDLYVQVNAVEQGAADFIEVALHHARPTYTLFVGVIIIPTGAGVHAGNEHKIGRKLYRPLRPRNAHHPVFQRLPHHLQSRPFELRQLIEKQNSVVRQRDFARLRKTPSAHQSRIRNSVVR